VKGDDMARGHIFRIIPLLGIAAGSSAIDIGWLFYLLRWQPSPISPFHSMELQPYLFILGFAFMAGFVAITFLRKK
jgi:hypothetical protein